jgi:hypothetical protein
MTVMLKTIDQVLGTRTEGPQLSFRAREVTARDIVRARVKAEVERYNNADPPSGFVGLVTPTEQECELNGHGASGGPRSTSSARSELRWRPCANAA